MKKSMPAAMTKKSSMSDEAKMMAGKSKEPPAGYKRGGAVKKAK